MDVVTKSGIIGICGVLIGFIGGVVGVIMVNTVFPDNTLFNSLPERGLYEAQDMRNQVFNESKCVEEKRILLMALIGEQVVNAVDNLLLEKAEVSVANLTISSTDITKDIDFNASLKAGEHEILLMGFLKDEKIKIVEIEATKSILKSL